ncbi:MAG: hypothetical protein JJU36_13305 [Phycisphaeraceae bacterium]|nr:hypothetical protein [Phycisphaeraceae bacterium]
MPDYIIYILNFSLGIHLLLIAICVHRVWKGENGLDRLLGVDLLGTLILAVLVIIAIRDQQPLYIDVAMGLAAVGFTSSILLAKYMADQQLR